MRSRLSLSISRRLPSPFVESGMLMSLSITRLKESVGKMVFSAELCDSSVPLRLKLLRKSFTTEAQRSRREPQSLFSDGRLKSDVNKKTVTAYRGQKKVSSWAAILSPAISSVSHWLAIRNQTFFSPCA